ncbi:MAG: glycosyl transferase [Phycisphaerae bacterium]|nr:glycosyl transferase [Gemmatimonadaceae bacterium]
MTMRKQDETIADAAEALTAGHFTTLVTDAGAGVSSYGAVALTRWRDDRTRDSDGFFLYVRDVHSGEQWSAGMQPMPAPTASYTIRRGPNTVELTRVDRGIEIATSVRLAHEQDAELRRYSVTNSGDAAREFELTTYAEVVLNRAAADSAHPAFSKLFVQTEYVAEYGALLAHRRARSPDDEVLWLVHCFTDDSSSSEVAGLQYETDRARFIGRGRSLAHPVALDGTGPLSSTVGNVLDPVVSLRRAVSIAPGETVHLTAVLGAGANRSAVTAVAKRYATRGAIDAVFEADAEVSSTVVIGAGVPSVPAGYAAKPSRIGQRDQRKSEAAPSMEPLQLFNEIGGFNGNGNEYVIRIADASAIDSRPPAPWVNVVANESIGFLISESGAAHTWSANGRENRLTSWYNDSVTDPHAEALYVRDEDSRDFWSPTPGPVAGAGPYEVRHGWGYTSFTHTSAELEQHTVQFVPRHDSVRIVRVRFRNLNNRKRRLSVFSYSELVLGDMLELSGRHVVTEQDAESGALFATNARRGEFSHRVAFATGSATGESQAFVSGDRTSVLGRYGSTYAPAALTSEETLECRCGAGLDPCAAVQVTVQIEAGGEAEVVFLLGEIGSAEEARALVARYAEPEAVDRALDEVKTFWSELLGTIRIETPEPSIDLLVNGWLGYQNLVCRMWARTAFYQSGGAFGFRDQLQDSAALLYLDASITRRQIVLNAAHQFVEGDVLHWWHPPLSKGIRTRFSDDLLWLPYITAFYVRATNDSSVLDEQTRFVAARLLEQGEDEAFLFPEDSGVQADVYEHCCLALDRSLTRGVNGLPLMGTGDWNDGMNRVGREGRGESVWLGFFLHNILEDFLPFVDRRNDHDRAQRYRSYQTALATALNEGGWDGSWYRRAYYDNGASIGAAANDECRIDAIAQAWAVISGVAPPARVEQALDALEAHLVDTNHKIIRLLTPAFDKTPHDPGYIKGYLPGVRENGGQYTHAALWAVRAFAEAGRTERAAPLLAMLSSVSHTATAAGVATYKAEPYVIAADVYGVAPHNGRGGWTWYTGSAGWYFRVALESVLGVELIENRLLSLKPCIPRDWPGFRVHYRLPDGLTTYEIEVRQDASGEADIPTGTLDGVALQVDDARVLVPLKADGATHVVIVQIHSDFPLLRRR